MTLLSLSYILIQFKHSEIYKQIWIKFKHCYADGVLKPKIANLHISPSHEQPTCISVKLNNQHLPQANEVKYFGIQTITMELSHRQTTKSEIESNILANWS